MSAYAMTEVENDIPWDLPDPYVIKVAVSSDDIDGYGHVNNAVFVAWMDRCAFAHADSVGIDADFCRSIDTGMAAIRHEIDYLASGYKGDEIVIGDWVTLNDGKLRAQRRFQIIRKSDKRTLLRCTSNYVCTSLSRGKPTRLPKEFISKYSVLPSVAKALSDESTI